MGDQMSEPFPSTLSPMLATPSTVLPADSEVGGDTWAYELKWDGVRGMAYLRGGSLRLESRNHNDLTGRYPELADLAAAAAGHDLVLDGEVVAFDEHGRPSFGLLQTRMHVRGEREIAARVGAAPLAYLIFDILHLDGASTRDLPWLDRRALLEGLDLRGPAWDTPKAHVGAGTAVLEATKTDGLEGVVAKRTASLYTPGHRSRDWRKLKNTHRQELVIGGWVPGAGNRTGRIGALLVGYHDDDGRLRFAGKVGTGFTDAELLRLRSLFATRARESSPFSDQVPHKAAQYLEPDLVAEIEYTEWTHTATLRHPSYKGLRDDKDAADVRRET